MNELLPQWMRSACVLLALAAAGCFGPKPVTEDDKIEHLLAWTAGLKDATFVMDGKNVTPPAAAERFRAAWESKRAEVKTAKDFIRVAGTFSTEGGSQYLVKYADGGQDFTSNALTAELSRWELELWRSR